MTASQLTRTSPRRDHGWAVDVVAGVLATAFLLLASGHIAPSGDDRALDALGYALLVLAGASIGICRRWPTLALAFATVALGGYLAGRYPGGPIYVVGWVVLFSLSWRTDRRTGLIGAGVLFAVLSITSVLVGDAPLLLQLVFLGWSAAAVFLGDALRNRRGYLHELEERARSLELTREEEARRQVAEERLRIARDLHDSVAHAIATINVQAGAAAHVLDRRPESAKPALDAIQDTSREVLDELATMLRLLRNEHDGAARAPTPGIAEITELVEAARASHLRVALEVRGSIDGVGAAVGTAAYRIVQESLTNVLRHAPGARTRVVVERGIDHALRVEVHDDGGGRAPSVGEPAGAGMGIRGMRERVAATGGELDIGPTPEGGFRVVATWPAT